jgi:hypothetical protein
MRRRPGAIATARQLVILAALIAGHRELGTAPPVKWIMERLSIKADKTVHEILFNLERHGLVRVLYGKRVPTAAGYRTLGLLATIRFDDAVKRLVAGKADDDLLATIKRHFDAIKRIQDGRAD